MKSLIKKKLVPQLQPKKWRPYPTPIERHWRKKKKELSIISTAYNCGSKINYQTRQTDTRSNSRINFGDSFYYKAFCAFFLAAT